MENKVHYSKAIACGVLDEFDKIMDETERRYPNDDHVVTVGIMFLIAMTDGARDALGDDLFYRNLNDIPDTKEALIELLEEIQVKLNDHGFDVDFNEFKETLMKEPE